MGAVSDLISDVSDLVDRARATVLGMAGALGGGFDTSGRGELKTRMVLMAAKRESVERLLPEDGLELGPQTVVPYPWHPVLVLFSHFEFDVQPPLRAAEFEYREAFVAVPFTQLSGAGRGKRGPFIYIPRFYLDKADPRTLGHIFFGFEKLPARILDTPTSFVVRNEENGPIMTGEFGPPAGPMIDAKDDPNFDVIRDILGQWTVSQATRALVADARKGLSTFLYSYLDFFPNGTEPKVRPVGARVEITGRFEPDVLRVDTADGSAHVVAAFEVESKFALALPLSDHPTAPRPPPTGRKKRVVVVGGGPAACAAAFHLAKESDRFEVTMYTQGHRLGGKCSAWLNPARQHRTEEHGLHAFLGFYQNAPATLQQAYEVAYGDSDGRALWDSAFSKEQDAGLMLEHGGEWRFVRTPSVPAGKDAAMELFDRVPLSDKVVRGVQELIKQTIQKLIDGHLSVPFSWDFWVRALRATLGADPLSVLAGGVTLFNGVDIPAALAFIGRESFDLLVHPLEALKDLADTLETVIELGPKDGSLLATVRTVRWALRALFNEGGVDPSSEAHFYWTALDTLLTALCGLIEGEHKHYDELDRWDYREWLRLNGSSEGIARWPIISHLYETLFASQEDPTAPVPLGAGVALRWFVHECFAQGETAAWRFRWSSARTMMSPYYDALKKLGVKIHFFNVLVGVDTVGSGLNRRLKSLRFQAQAKLPPGVEYEPLVAPAVLTGGLEDKVRDWPKDAQSAQLIGAPVGVDYYDMWAFTPNPADQFLIHPRSEPGHETTGFDECVLAVPVGAFPLIDGPLTRATISDDPRWRAQASIMRVQTWSMQLWFRDSYDQLYTGPRRGLTTCFEQPEPSYGDFTQLLRDEMWPPGPGLPKLVAYFTGCRGTAEQGLPGTTPVTYPADQLARMVNFAVPWLQNEGRRFFDRVSGPIAARVMAAAGSVSPLTDQHFVAAVQPSDLYVLSIPGETEHRLGQAETGVRHLLVAGDWTRTDWNCGCVEAATQSGMLAAHAVTGAVSLLWRVGF